MITGGQRVKQDRRTVVINGRYNWLDLSYSRWLNNRQQALLRHHHDKAGTVDWLGPCHCDVELDTLAAV